MYKRQQCKTARVEEACYCCKRRGHPCLLPNQSSGEERCLQPSKGMSYNQQHSSGPFSKPLPGRIQCTTCGRHGHHFEVCPKRDIMCYHCEQHGHYANKCPIKKLDPLELGLLLFKRQVEDETLSEAMSHCSLDGSYASPGNENNSQPSGQMPGSGQQNNQCMTLFNSLAFLSIMQLPHESAETQATPAKRICYKCREEGHYANKCPQAYPTETLIRKNYVTG